MSEQGTVEAALWRLAERLHEKWEVLDPSGEEWSELTDLEKDFCYFLVSDVLRFRDDVLIVLNQGEQG